MPKDFFFVTVERKDKEVDIAQCIQAEKEALDKLSTYEELLTF